MCVHVHVCVCVRVCARVRPALVDVVAIGLVRNASFNVIYPFSFLETLLHPRYLDASERVYV